MSILQYLATVKQTRLMTETLMFWYLCRDLRKNKKPSKTLETEISFYLGRTKTQKLQQRLLSLNDENNANLEKGLYPLPWFDSLVKGSYLNLILRRINIQDIRLLDLNIEKYTPAYLSNVQAVKIYYCFYGRNAWHSTWTQKYSQDCMHVTLSAAKQYAEKQRKQGSVFYIKELPALQIESTDGHTILVVQINSSTPLAEYSSQAFHSAQALPSLLISSVGEYGDNCLAVGASLVKALYSFSSTSKFWKSPPPSENSIIILAVGDRHKALALNAAIELKAWKGHSFGKEKHLGWIHKDNNIDKKFIMELCDQSKSKSKLSPLSIF
ncbi:MAG: hypothetical protein COA46_08570 [Porticoccaceae bacterium]|nr:MAG: hypothetical protein COA46_08570 [Porticoccaceae bacterium]